MELKNQTQLANESVSSWREHFSSLTIVEMPKISENHKIQAIQLKKKHEKISEALIQRKLKVSIHEACLLMEYIKNG